MQLHHMIPIHRYANRIQSNRITKLVAHHSFHAAETTVDPVPSLGVEGSTLEITRRNNFLRAVVDDTKRADLFQVGRAGLCARKHTHVGVLQHQRSPCQICLCSAQCLHLVGNLVHPVVDEHDLVGEHLVLLLRHSASTAACTRTTLQSRVNLLVNKFEFVVVIFQKLLEGSDPALRVGHALANHGIVLSWIGVPLEFFNFLLIASDGIVQFRILLIHNQHQPHTKGPKN
mmetsp:Transcript_14309/g.28523  ORF Transcript_14309/g.28523 Transcript_14309/m.28523 type:complete len:230 (-) Transcript_14309:42-731(-)